METPKHDSDEAPAQPETTDTSRRDFLIGASVAIAAVALKISSNMRKGIADSNKREQEDQEYKNSDPRIARLQRIFERMLGIEAALPGADAAAKAKFHAELKTLNQEFQEIRQEHSTTAPLIEPYGSHYLHAILRSQQRIEWDARK